MERTAQVIDFKASSRCSTRQDRRSWPHGACGNCGQRESRFFAHEPEHCAVATLCFECYRALVNRTKATTGSVDGDLRMFASARPKPASVRGDRARFYDGLHRRLHQAQIVARHAVDGVVGAAPRPPAVDALQRVS